jgi:hypothetical protein
MRKTNLSCQLWIFTAPIILAATARPLTALPQQSVEKCERLAKAVTGLTYHRSAEDALNTGQIWQFMAQEKLRMRVADGATGSLAAKSSEALWQIAFEDERCVLKVSPIKTPPHWTTYRITDTTWAIVDTRKFLGQGQGEEKFVPDLEDHTGMKTRFCGIGDRCEKLWK